MWTRASNQSVINNRTKLQLLNLARSTPLHGQQENLEENNSAIKNGVFDVDIDEKVVYSKLTTERSQIVENF